MSLLITLKSLYPELPEAEKRVAEYILKHYDRVPYESVSRIARAVDVSVPSVTRLTKKLGCESFKDFKVGLAVSTVQPSAVGEIFSTVTEDDSDSDVIDKVFMGNIVSLEDTLKILDKEKVSQVAGHIADASRVVFIGQGGSGVVASEAALRFAHLNIQAEAYQDMIQIILQTERMQKGSVCIGISHSGRTELVSEGLEIARDGGAITVLITNYIKTPLKAVSDYVIYTSFVENSVKAAAISSTIAQVALIDTLYLLTAKMKKTMWDFTTLNRTIERLTKL